MWVGASTPLAMPFFVGVRAVMAAEATEAAAASERGPLVATSLVMVGLPIVRISAFRGCFCCLFLCPIYNRMVVMVSATNWGI